MKISVSAVLALLCVSQLSSASPLSPVQKIPPEETRRMIVIMRDQRLEVPSVRGAHATRSSALRAAQEPVVSGLQRSRSRSVRSFEMINAFATELTKTEIDQLAAHPAVRAVVPDALVPRPPRPQRLLRSTVPSTGSGGAIPPIDNPQLCDTLEPEALQLTNTAFLDPKVPQAQSVLDGNGLTVTGRGVKVAYIADGLDPANAGFVRPDGSSVFIDYQDFSGDPAGTATEGAEAFGDASSIAAQDLPNGTPLLFDISAFGFASLPTPCNIRVRGVAPGASLVGLKIFSNLGKSFFVSSAVQAIEWAVIHDDVDVINESFGENPYPDNTNDPISLANSLAVLAGVTVVVSSGDAGTAGTLGSPSTASNVIESGATTQQRLYAQTGELFTTGYLDNNISAFSSSGFGEKRPRTIDVVAPGELGWALCSTNPLYSGCTDFSGNPSPVQAFGGTSESSPLTAGEAALIIQAYRSTHHGASPSPALVKQIIMSTATDLGAPSSEQGAGLINTLKAVQVALSLQDRSGRPKPRGDGILILPTSAELVAPAGQHQVQQFQVMNTSSTTMHLTPNLQTLDAPFAGQTFNFPMDGNNNSFIEGVFTVPGNADHLDAAIAFQSSFGATNAFVFLYLIDPTGHQAAYSVPQGADSGYGHVDVVHPAAGDWIALIITYPASVQSGAFTYTGPAQFSWSAEKYVNLGSTFPATLNLTPGASGVITSVFNMPSQAGDTAAAIRFGGTANLAEIPVTLRSLVPINQSGGTFTGILTGGNGRGGSGPVSTFAFDVPNGIGDMAVSITLSDPGYLLEGLLIDPNGMPLSVQGNIDANDKLVGALQHFRDHPQAGRWRFLVLENYYSSGNQTSIQYNGQIKFNSAQVSASGLPNNRRTKLSASGGPITVAISLTNTGVDAQAYFADARLSGRSRQTLLVSPCDGTTVTVPAYCGSTYLPTQVSGVQFTAQAAVPITMDASNGQGFLVGYTGAPDLWAFPAGHGKVIASLDTAEVPPGNWAVLASTIGPYGAAGAQTSPVTATATVTMQPFDAAIAADSGDIWADLTFGTATYNPLVLQPGQSGQINLTITPDPSQVGNVVSGTVYLDTFNQVVFTGDEVARIPYSYQVGR